MSAGIRFLELEEADDADRLDAHGRVGVAQRFEGGLERFAAPQLLERAKRRHPHEPAGMRHQPIDRIRRGGVLELRHAVRGRRRHRRFGVDHHAGERGRRLDPVIFAERQRHLAPHPGIGIGDHGAEQRDRGGVAGMAEFHDGDAALAGVRRLQAHREFIEIVILFERVGHAALT